MVLRRICTQHANALRVCAFVRTFVNVTSPAKVLEHCDLSAFSVGVTEDLIYNVLRTWHLFDKWQSLYSHRNCRKLRHSSRQKIDIAVV